MGLTICGGLEDLTGTGNCKGEETGEAMISTRTGCDDQTLGPGGLEHSLRCRPHYSITDEQSVTITLILRPHRHSHG